MKNKILTIILLLWIILLTSKQVYNLNVHTINGPIIDLDCKNRDILYGKIIDNSNNENIMHLKFNNSNKAIITCANNECNSEFSFVIFQEPYNAIKIGSKTYKVLEDEAIIFKSEKPEYIREFLSRKAKIKVVKFETEKIKLSKEEIELKKDKVKLNMRLGRYNYCHTKVDKTDNIIDIDLFKNP